jgi:hypothetical protein
VKGVGSLAAAGIAGLLAACAAAGIDSPKPVRSTAALRRPEWPDPLAHALNWVVSHREAAGTDSAACARCHDDRSCTDCHDGRTRPRSLHPGNWLDTHAVAARAQTTRCESCHRAQSFCVPCHQRAGVAQSAPIATLTRQGRFHPSATVWSGTVRTRQHHAWEAQRHLASCVSCHVESDCTACHGTAQVGSRGSGPTGSPRLSPHSAGFGHWCRSAWRKNARPCLVCHEESDSLLDRCR